jgi:hypothetical protein
MLWIRIWIKSGLAIKPLDLNPDSLEMLDPDPDSMNLDPQHWHFGLES